MVSLICTLTDHRDDVNWCAFSTKLLATCSGDKTLRIYNTHDFSELPFSPLSGHGYSVHCCCFSACGQFLASCSTDSTTVIWSMVSGEIDAVLEHPGCSPVRICALSPDSVYLVSGASDGTLALWDFPSKQLRRTGSVDNTTMVACCFSPCSQLFVTGSTYGDLRLWNLDMNQLHAEKNAHDLGVTCCTFAPSILGACKMQLLHTLSGQSAPVLSCAYSSDGQLLVSGYVTACSFSPTSPLIATGSMDKSVNIWRVEDGCSGREESALTTGEGKTSAGRSKLLVSDWSEEDVSVWLREEGLEGLVDKFMANNIDGTELLGLTKETLASELHIESVGLRSKVLRKVEELKSESVCSGIPDEFLCPITRELMREPVIAADGYSYERGAIASWINTKNRTSPMTNLPLLTTLLTPNHTLKMAIGRWKTSH
ncbi:hypothetical protein PAMA_000622 [Pampus argenteus]